MQIDLKQPILQKNDAIASELRERFAENHVFVLDLLASPGSGKTSTILATIDALRDEFNIAVIEATSPATWTLRRSSAGHPRRTNKHGRRVPPGERHAQARRGRAGSRAPGPHHRGERGQPRVPHGFRSGREREGHDPIRSRGRRQAAQVPAHLHCVRRAHSSTRSTCCRISTSTWKRSSNTRTCATRSSSIFPLSAKTGEGVAAWCNWLREQVRAWNG